MAEDKKGFILYADLIHTVKKLKKEDAGELLMHILEYVNDMNPTTENYIVDITFEPIKHQLKRDLNKYEKRAERSKINGALGGRPKKEETQKTQQVILEPKKPDTVNVTDTVTDNVNDILLEKETKEVSEKIDIEKLLEYINKTFNKKYKPAHLYGAQERKLFELQKIYTKPEIFQTLNNIYEDKWCKEQKYAHVTINWLFSEDTIQKYLHLTPKKESKKLNPTRYMEW